MKKFKVLISILFIFTTYQITFSQNEDLLFHCYLDSTEAVGNMPLSQPDTYNITYLLCVEQGQSTHISNFFLNDLQKIKDYYSTVSHGNVLINNVDVLGRELNLDGSLEAFELSGTLVAQPPLNETFVVPEALVLEVLDSADSIYNFNDFDYDSDGIVDMLIFMVVRYSELDTAGVRKWSTGTPGLPNSLVFSTDDLSTEGDTIIIDGSGYMTRSADHAMIQRKRVSKADNIISITVHELGHAWFSFPDVDHLGRTHFDHWAFGSFDEMAKTGFKGTPSLYNPIFRIRSNWINPVEITSNQTLTIEDFDESGIIYYYDIPDHNGISVGSQRIYLTCYNNPESNYWQQNWPLPGSGEISTGLLIWRENRNLNPFFTSNYEDALYMPIDIEAAHGKWIWNNLDLSEAPPADLKPINSGIADPLFGRDSLETHNTYYYLGFVGYNDTTGEAEYEGEPVYADWRVGSESCFYSPFNSTREYAFYTNPNSCSKTIETLNGVHSNSVSSEFKLENIRRDNDNILVDVKVGVDANVVKQNTTLPSGRWRFFNDVTVTVGVNFIIDDNTELIFENGSRLIVNGALIAQGTSENPIVFDFISRNSSTQNGIVVNSSGDLTVNNSVIKNAYRGVYSTASAVDIRNSEITSCWHGIFLYDTNPASSIILDNEIHHNSSYGIGLIESDADIRGNEIYYNDRGIYCTQYSAPDLGKDFYYGNNYIHNNERGLYAYYASDPFLGHVGCVIEGGHNSFYGNVLSAVYANYNCSIHAQKNWWGSYPVDIGEFKELNNSNIDYSFALQSNPLSKPNTENPEEKDFDAAFASLTEKNNSTDESLGLDPTWPLKWKRLYVRRLISVGKYEAAKNICKNIISANIDSAETETFLPLLYQAYINTTEKSPVRFLNQFVSDRKQADRPIHALMILLINEFESDPNKRIETYNFAAEKFKNTNAGEAALFSKLVYYLFSLDKINEAKITLDELKSQYKNSPVIEDAELLLGVGSKEEGKDMKLQNNNEEYQLLGAYPNPSNPATTIKYSLPYASNVKIEIFDITGSRIKTFEIPAQSAGIQKVSWDGFNDNGISVASGIYIYRFSAVPVGNVGKEFVKSAKIMLLK